MSYECIDIYLCHHIHKHLPRPFSSVLTAFHETKYKTTFLSLGKIPPQQHCHWQFIALQKCLHNRAERVLLCIINLLGMLCLWVAPWPIQIWLKLGKWVKERERGWRCFSSDNKSKQKWSFHFVVKVDRAVVLGWIHAVHLFYYVTAFSILALSHSSTLCSLRYFIYRPAYTSPLFLFCHSDFLIL